MKKCVLSNFMSMQIGSSRARCAGSAPGCPRPRGTRARAGGGAGGCAAPSPPRAGRQGTAHAPPRSRKEQKKSMIVSSSSETTRGLRPTASAEEQSGRNADERLPTVASSEPKFWTTAAIRRLRCCGPADRLQQVLDEVLRAVQVDEGAHDRRRVRRIHLGSPELISLQSMPAWNETATEMARL